MTGASGLSTSDPPVATVTLDSGPLAFVDEGPEDAPAVFAIHGIPGSSRDFRYLAPALSDRVRFVRVDMPGFGASPPERGAIRSLAGRARVLLGLADRLGIARFAALGHSMGGATALSLAADHRERVSALFLLASVGLRRHRGLGVHPRAFRWMSRGLLVPGLRGWLVHAARERYRRRGFPGADLMPAAAFATHFDAIGAADFAALERAARAALPPTLIAWAVDDHMVEPEIPADLARALPHARTLVFAAGGHNIQKTCAAELAAAIRDVLGVA